MHLRLERQPNDRGTPGDLFVDGEHAAVTLEPRLSHPEYPAIPYGTYDVTVRPTYNARLWTPTDERLLPHVENVPGRRGIEIHAGNCPDDTEGCILVGTQRADTLNEILESRRALVALMERLDFPCQITILDAPGALA
jgi:hypothetical protein